MFRRFIETANRKASEFRDEANVGTVMHEVAHQLSFNCGLLNREGDVPFWLGEGLATYCEAREQGFWKGIGAANPERLRPLAAARRGQLAFLPVRSLVESDQWLYGPGGGQRVSTSVVAAGGLGGGTRSGERR